MVMQSVPVGISRVPRVGEPLRGEVIVGKDILELLSTAMYVDPLAILREYVQNAADAIDSAYGEGILTLKQVGRIDVELDPDARTLVVRDNGTGVPAADAERALVAFGASGKRGKGLRGFRGIGRLGGLGYARGLIFRTRSVGEADVTELYWDCRELREQLLASGGKPDLEDIVRRIVSVRQVRPKESETHFFEVRLEGVVRLWNDRLLNSEEVSSYLTQVCPLPFNPRLPFAGEIEDLLGRHLSRKRFDLHVNRAAEPLRRPHRAEFAVSSTKRDRFSECQLIELPGLDGQPAAVGWILHHNYLGAIKKAVEIRGLRARSGDMQVGDGEIFAKSFPESRFNAWVVGELHMLDRRLLPNGRRDNFEHNVAYTSLLNQLVPLCRDLAHRCRSSSVRRSRMRTFEEYEREAKRLLRDLRLGAPGGKSRRSVLTIVDGLLDRMGKLIRTALFAEAVTRNLQTRVKRLAALKRPVAAAPEKEGPVVPASKRRIYNEITRLVRACAPSKKVATSLLQRIANRLAQQYRR